MIGSGKSGGAIFWSGLGAYLIVTGVLVAQQTLSSTRSKDTSALPAACIKQGHSSERIAALLESVQDHPTAGAYNTLGVLYAQGDKVSCALSAFKNALRLDNGNWEVHYNYGLALLRARQQASAKKELQTAIQKKPDAVSAHFALGTLLESEQQLSAAEDAFRAALNIDNKFSPAALKLSEVLLSENHADAAVSVLLESLKQARSDEVESLDTALGVAYVRAGDVEKGIAELTNVVTTHSNSADARLALGMALLSSQDYSQAASNLLEYTRVKPHDGQGFYALGRAYEALGKIDLATHALQHAATLASRDSDIHFHLGVDMAALGKTKDAITELRAAERIRPTDPDTHQQLAALLEKSGDIEGARAERLKFSQLNATQNKDRTVEELNQRANRFLAQGNARAARETYAKALQLNPNDAKLRYNFALALDKSSDASGERKELERAIQLDPSLAVAHNQLGLLALAAGQYAEAGERFRKALAIDPAFAEAESNLGIVYSQQGKNSEAASLFQQAIQHDPKYAKAYVNLGLLKGQQGDFASAERQFQAAIQSDPNYIGAYSALGMLQAKTGHGTEAVKAFEKAVAIEPQSAEAHLNLGIALVDQFDRPSGLKEFSEAARLDPNLAAVHYNLGRFFFETGKYDEAHRELETAIRLQPDYPSALYFLALTMKQQDDPRSATALLQKLVGLQPDNANAQYLLGQSLEHSGDNAGAIQHWKMAVQSDPNHSQALYNLAKALSKVHDPEAQQYQERFDALQRQQQITDRVAELGNFALEAANAQNWPQAMEQMNQAIQLCGTCSESAHLHRNLGVFYGRTGNLENAEKELQTAVTLAPDDVDARNALAAIERIQKSQDK